MSSIKRVVSEQSKKDQKGNDVRRYWRKIEPCVLRSIGGSETSKLTRQPGDLESGQDIGTPKALWGFLHEKRNAYSEFPAHRINIDSWYHPEVNHTCTFYT